MLVYICMVCRNISKLLAMALIFTVAVFCGTGGANAQGVLGEAEGRSFTLTCRRGEVVTGLVGREGARVDAIGISCRQINTLTLRPVEGSGSDSQHVGGRGGRPKSIWCEHGWLPAGISGVWLETHRDLATIRIVCKPFTTRRGSDGLLAGHGYVVSVPCPISAGSLQRNCKMSNDLGGNPYGRDRKLTACSRGKVIIGLRVWSDQYVNAVQAICG